MTSSTDFEIVQFYRQRDDSKLFIVKMRVGDNAGRHYIMEVVQATTSSEALASELSPKANDRDQASSPSVTGPLTADDYGRCVFAVNLEKVVRTGPKWRYFLEYPSGGSLRVLLRRRSATLGFGRPSSPRSPSTRPAAGRRGLGDSESSFYLAEIALALSELHRGGVAYGALSAENALLDSDGHVKLLRTVHGQSYWVRKTRSACDDPDGLPVSHGEEDGKEFAADWQLFVSLLVELLTGQRRDVTQDRSAVVKFLSENAGTLASSVLDRIEEGRNVDLDMLKGSDFFKDIDWFELGEKRLPAPAVPCQPEFDTSASSPRATDLRPRSATFDSSLRATTFSRRSPHSTGSPTLPSAALFRTSTWKRRDPMDEQGKLSERRSQSVRPVLCTPPRRHSRFSTSPEDQQQQQQEDKVTHDSLGSPLLRTYSGTGRKITVRQASEPAGRDEQVGLVMRRSRSEDFRGYGVVIGKNPSLGVSDDRGLGCMTAGTSSIVDGDTTYQAKAAVEETAAGGRGASPPSSSVPLCAKETALKESESNAENGSDLVTVFADSRTSCNSVEERTTDGIVPTRPRSHSAFEIDKLRRRLGLQTEGEHDNANIGSEQESPLSLCPPAGFEDSSDDEVLSTNTPKTCKDPHSSLSGRESKLRLDILTTLDNHFERPTSPALESPKIVITDTEGLFQSTFFEEWGDKSTVENNRDEPLISERNSTASPEDGRERVRPATLTLPLSAEQLRHNQQEVGNLIDGVVVPRPRSCQEPVLSCQGSRHKTDYTIGLRRRALWLGKFGSMDGVESDDGEDLDPKWTQRMEHMASTLERTIDSFDDDTSDLSDQEEPVQTVLRGTSSSPSSDINPSSSSLSRQGRSNDGGDNKTVPIEPTAPFHHYNPIVRKGALKFKRLRISPNHRGKGRGASGDNPLQSCFLQVPAADLSVSSDNEDERHSSPSISHCKTRKLLRRATSGKCKKAEEVLLTERLCEDCNQWKEMKFRHLEMERAVCPSCAGHRSKRAAAVLELVASEKSYGEGLSVLQEVYIPPLRDSLLSTTDCEKIFLNLQELVDVHRGLLADLQVQLDSLEEDRPNYETAHKVCVGDVLLKNIGRMTAFEFYCINMARGARLLESLAKKTELLRIFLRVTQMENERCKNMSLPTFLISPMQRITRYPLLLSKLLHHTQPRNPDHATIKQCMEQLGELLDRINSASEKSSIGRKLSFRKGRSSPVREVQMAVDVGKMVVFALQCLGWDEADSNLLYHGRVEVSVQQLEGVGRGPPKHQYRKRSGSLAFLYALLFCCNIGQTTQDIRPQKESSHHYMQPHAAADRKPHLVILTLSKDNTLVCYKEPIALANCIVSEVLEQDLAGQRASTSQFHVTHLAQCRLYSFTVDRDEHAVWMKHFESVIPNAGTWRLRRRALANIMITTDAVPTANHGNSSQ